MASSYDGSFRLTNSQNTKAMINFNGTGITLFGAFRPNHGNYTVDLDDGVPFTANGGGHGNMFTQPLWQAYNLDLGVHTVEVTNEPLSSSNNYFDLDFVSIERIIGQESDTIFNATLDDAGQFVHYTGSWQPSFTQAAQNFNGTVHQTTAVNSSLVITFQGCCIELYGLYANAVYAVGIDNQPVQVMQGLDIDLEQDVWHPQTLLYLMEGLSENVNHTVTVSNLRANVERPFFFDYATVSGTQNLTSFVAPSTAGGSPSSTGDSPSNSHSRGIPLGAIIGITLSVAVFLALVGTVYLLLRRRRLRRRLELAQPEVEPYDLIQRHMNSSIQAPNPGSTAPSAIQTVQSPSVVGIRQLTFAEGPAQNTASSQSYRSPGASYGSNSRTNTKGTSSTSRAESSVQGRDRGTNGEAALPSVEMRTREEDAGVSLGETFPTGSLPPAYSPAWDRRP